MIRMRLSLIHGQKESQKMKPDLHMGSMDVPSLHDTALIQPLAQFTVPIAESHIGDIIGIEVELCYTQSGLVHVSPLYHFITRTNTGFHKREWQTLEHGDPLRTKIGPSLIDIAIALDRLADQSDMTSALDNLCSPIRKLNFSVSA